MESIYTELALYDSKNMFARTDTVFLPISEVCDGTVSLMNSHLPMWARVSSSVAGASSSAALVCGTGMS